MPTAIRPGRRSDLDTLLQLEQNFDAGERISLRSWQRFLVQLGPVHVAEIGGVLAAAAVILTRRNSTRARLYSLITDPAFRGRGVARALMEQVEADLMQRGFDCLALEVRADNDPAIGLYQRLGFQMCGQRPGYYSDGMQAVLMEKSLVVREGPE